MGTCIISAVAIDVSIAQYFSLYVTWLCCAKSAEQIEVQFAMVLTKAHSVIWGVPIPLE